RHPDILLSALAIFELGLAPQRLGAPVRDALVMAVAFGGASVVPLLPFMVTQGLAALGLSAALTLVALFCVGVLTARVAGVSALRSSAGRRAVASSSGALFGRGSANIACMSARTRASCSGVRPRRSFSSRTCIGPG